MRYATSVGRHLAAALLIASLPAAGIALASGDSTPGSGRVALVFDVRGSVQGRTQVRATLRHGHIRLRFETRDLRLGKRHQRRVHRIVLKFSARPLCAGRLGRIKAVSVDTRRAGSSRFLVPRGAIVLRASCRRPARLGAFVEADVIAQGSGALLARSASSIPVLEVAQNHGRR